MAILLMAIGGALCYYWLLLIILLVAICGYVINGYCWLLYCKPLVVILLEGIDGY